MRKLKNEELGRLSAEEFKSSGKLPVVLVLDNVRSLHNVGSVFRTADAFRLQAIYLCGYTGFPPDREINKTALGATETVDWKYFKTTAEAIAELKANHFKIYSVEQAENALLLNKVSFKGKENIALVFGNEVYGVEQDIINLSDACIEIPQLGSKHSLNISVAVGIVCWEIVARSFLSSGEAG
jgi:23S rRNA (guanosine2251-2'-O)-methyltransferase